MSNNLIEIRFFTDNEPSEGKFIKQGESITDLFKELYAFIEDNDKIEKLLTLYFDALTFYTSSDYLVEIDPTSKLYENSNVHIKFDLNKYLVFSNFLESIIQ